MNWKKISPLAAAFTLWLLPQPLQACGPFFPNNLLDSGDQAVLGAPTANFEKELVRMKLVTRFSAVPATNGFAQQTVDLELADLALALVREKVSAIESERIVTAHRANRERLLKFEQERKGWLAKNPPAVGEDHVTEPDGAKPSSPNFAEVPGLPGEFADYFEGAVAANDPTADLGAEREPWERLLKRPAAERKYKSTWAAFMLGRTWTQGAEKDEERAIGYFQQVRILAKQGFADSAGLAAASAGAEAKIYYQRKEHLRALELYLEQFAAGDESALNSLRWTAAQVLAVNGPDGAVLAEFARSPRAQRVLTAYLISRDPSSVTFNSEPADADTSRAESPSVRWLNAVEAAGVSDVESGELLALAAYRTGDMELAQRWLARARSTPVTEWLQSKLLLRAGKVDEAAALLGKVSRSFPLELPGTNPPARLADDLSVDINPVYGDQISAGQQILGELGVLHLARREFTQSLDALLRSSYWMDAAYVAERVLTADELKKYVDANWPAVSPEELAKETKEAHDGENILTNPRREIRYLLARRLARLNRDDEAREYFPTELQPRFDALVAVLQTAWTESLLPEARAKAFFAAAWITRSNGMELLGTELAPDWAIHGGSFDCGVNVETRTNDNFKLLSASAEELERARQPASSPEERFHYRYQAASLAWEAAKLLPNNSNETARVLCTGGSWLKNLDAEVADIFYKALVRRCRKTAIGDVADRRRWFPILDENGNLQLPRLEALAPPTPEQISRGENPAHYPIPGRNFVFCKDDQLRDVAIAVRRLGYAMTTKEIIAANPGLDPMTIQTGQKIFIPWPQTNAAPRVQAEIAATNSVPEVTPHETPAGDTYSIQSGDSIARIAWAVSQLGRPTTVQEIVDANPGLDPAQIKIGQVIRIPNVPPPSNEPPAQPNQ